MPETTATIGVFDAIHRGHAHILADVMRRARRSHTRPLVVTFDPAPQQLLCPGSFPGLIATRAESRRRLRAMGFSVLTLPFDESLRRLTAAGFMDMLARRGVTRLVMGYDHGFGSDRLTDTAAYRRLGRKAGIRVYRCDASPGHSSSEIRRALLDGDMQRAADVLGRPYTLKGKVVHGRALGRSLGFPTANVDIDTSLMLPAPGVYAARAYIGRGRRPRHAVVNIGRRPTVAADGRRDITVEAHLIDAPGLDLYGRSLRLDFVSRLRPERRFPDLAALRDAIAADVASARSLLAATPD